MFYRPAASFPGHTGPSAWSRGTPSVQGLRKDGTHTIVYHRAIILHFNNELCFSNIILYSLIYAPCSCAFHGPAASFPWHARPGLGFSKRSRCDEHILKKFDTWRQRTQSRQISSSRLDSEFENRAPGAESCSKPTLQGSQRWRPNHRVLRDLTTFAICAVCLQVRVPRICCATSRALRVRC